MKTLFIDKYPPTAEFKANNQGLSKNEIETMWFEQTANDRESFFRDAFYKKKFGADFPRDNTKAELVGSGRLISETELKIVMSWIGKGQVVPENLVVAKMISWSLFADEAKKSNFIKTENYRKVKEQFEKFEVVRYFVNEILGNKVENNFNPNKEFVKFAIADKSKNPTLNFEKEETDAFSDSLKTIMYEAGIIEYIHRKRTSVGVQLLQNDYVDMFVKTPAQLKHEADSLAANQNTERAMKTYKDLNEWFLYAPEGKSAFLELAKLQADAKAYNDAINSYRNYLLYDGSDSEWCRVFFTIGYIYAEYMEKYPFAAMNYRWILQNQPDCNLSADTEFLYLHLGEPMADVEELRQESIRQGRE
jgi:tetratricopeptide (TPR) repeat protein